MEWLNSDKGNGNDKDIKGAVHALIQARDAATGEGGQGIDYIERFYSPTWHHSKPEKAQEA